MPLARRPRPRHGRDAHRARLGELRPRLRAGGAERREPLAAHRDDRRGDRARVRRPRRDRRARGADRRPRPGRARAAAGALAHRRGRPPDPHARRLPPRPDHARRPRLGDPRLRGRAGAAAARAPAQALAAARRRGHAALVRLRRRPPRSCSAASPAPEGWEERAREAFLEGYFTTVDRRCCRRARRRPRKLLAVFELEKAVYELRYELNNRPDWVAIPVAGIARLLEAA